MPGVKIQIRDVRPEIVTPGKIRTIYHRGSRCIVCTILLVDCCNISDQEKFRRKTVLIIFLVLSFFLIELNFHSAVKMAGDMFVCCIAVVRRSVVRRKFSVSIPAA